MSHYSSKIYKVSFSRRNFILFSFNQNSSNIQQKILIFVFYINYSALLHVPVPIRSCYQCRNGLKKNQRK